MMKLLHTADIHLDSPLRSLALRDRDLQAAVRSAGRAAFTHIVNMAIEENVSALLLAGDLFDSARRSAQTLAFLRARLEQLNAAQIPVYCIKGNHDAENPLLNMMDWPENVTIFSAAGETAQLPRNAPDGRPVYIHGVSFKSRHARQSLLKKFPAPQSQALNIGLLHTSLSSAEGDVYAPCSVAELAAFGYDYWALGHIHKRDVYRQNNSLIVMPGCPQGRDIGEAGLKSATMLRIDAHGGLQAEERKSCALAFFCLTVAADTADAAELRRRMETELERFCAARGGADKIALRLELNGATSLYWQLRRDYDYWRETAEELLKAQDSVWLDSLKLNIDEPEAEHLSESEGAAAALDAQEFIGFMRAAAKSAACGEEADKELGKLLNSLPAAVRRALCPDKAAEAALLSEALGGGAEEIAALLEAEAHGAETGNAEADTAEAG